MMFAVKLKIGLIGAVRNNRRTACTPQAKLLTGHLVNRSSLSLPIKRGSSQIIHTHKPYLGGCQTQYDSLRNMCWSAITYE